MNLKREEGARDEPESRRGDRQEAKKPYEAPRLLKFGPVEELTGLSPS